MFGGAECWIARLGYSGETGYELSSPTRRRRALAGAARRGRGRGLVECGFDATDSLRIEAGHILFTRELASPITPFELGFARLVDFDWREFHGAPALREHRRQEPLRRLVGLLPAQDAEPELERARAPRGGQRRHDERLLVASPGRRLGIGFVSARDADPGTTVRLADGARARVARLPFYDPAKVLPRRAT